MVTKFRVHQKVAESWKPRNGKEGGSREYLLLLDTSTPAEHRMRKMVMFTIRDDDHEGQAVFRDHPEDKEFNFAVNEIMFGKTAPVLIGKILPVEASRPAGK